MTPTMTPRNYQKTAIDYISNLHLTKTSSRVVLAAATGSGKTEMAIMLIENFISHNLGRVLVVAHHTNVIKSNFVSRLDQVNPNFSYSDSDTNVDCFVTIRQNIDKVDTDNFSLIIVDEAHQNYFAQTIQNVLSDFSHQVLLTATPSKFVRHGGFDILPIARLDIPNKYFSNLSFRVVNCETSLNTDSYNSDDAVKTSIEFSRDEVMSMVDAVLPHLDDNKKLFICKDMKQARKVSMYLNRCGISTYVSDSECDPDGVIIDRFKSNEFNSLVVVDRMRVGYSDNDLYYTVDMSFTHNPDVIMQILSRSNRGNQSQSKFYIKLTNNALNVRTRFMLSIAISLFRSDNLIAYDGINTSNLNVPVVTGSTVTRTGNSNPDNWFIPDSIDVINFFNTCDFVSSSDILRSLGNYVSYTYELCLQIAKNYKSWSEMCRFNSGVRFYITNNGLRDKFCADAGYVQPRVKVPGIKYADLDKATVMSLASKYEYLYEFKSGNNSAFKFATNNNFIDELIGSTGNFLSSPVRKCECCGTEFRNKRAHSVYCSSDCKKAARYERVKLQRAEQKSKYGKRLY